MSNGIFNVPYPCNEPVLDYAPGSPERRELVTELDRMSRRVIDIPAPLPEPEHEVLDSLLAAPQAIQAEPVPETPTTAPPSESAAPKAGEAGVIDALIERATDAHEEGDED